MTKHRRKEAAPDDAVRTYLTKRGVSDHLIAAGLPEMVSRWESIAGSVDGYPFTLDDWLNDVDLRDIIAGALAVARGQVRRSVSARLEKADEQFRAATVASGPVWGAQAAAARSLDPDRCWWYFRIPRRPGDDLSADLSGAGLI